jgi:hypothetical protein
LGKVQHYCLRYLPDTQCVLDTLLTGAGMALAGAVMCEAAALPAGSLLHVPAARRLRQEMVGGLTLAPGALPQGVALDTGEACMEAAWRKSDAAVEL